MLSSLVGLAALAASPAPAQYSCPIPATNEWLSKGDRSDAQKLGLDRVHFVSERIPQSISRLRSRSAVLLSDADVQEFTGRSSATGSGARLRPYLVRAVYPTSNPTFDIRWDGKRLDVVSEGLGCEPYVKHPIIVFLERQPSEVYVMAFSAL